MSNLLPTGLPRIEKLEMVDIVKRFPAFWRMTMLILMLKPGKFIHYWERTAQEKAL